MTPGRDERDCRVRLAPERGQILRDRPDLAHRRFGRDGTGRWPLDLVHRRLLSDSRDAPAPRRVVRRRIRPPQQPREPLRQPSRRDCRLHDSARERRLSHGRPNGRDERGRREQVEADAITQPRFVVGGCQHDVGPRRQHGGAHQGMPRLAGAAIVDQAHAAPRQQRRVDVRNQIDRKRHEAAQSRRPRQIACRQRQS
jgi:hypothetical protein